MAETGHVGPQAAEVLLRGAPNMLFSTSDGETYRTDGQGYVGVFVHHADEMLGRHGLAYVHPPAEAAPDAADEPAAEAPKPRTRKHVEADK